MSKQTTIEAWNARCPVGTPVTYWPGFREGQGVESKTRSKAFLLSGHTPCVCVDGRLDGIALAHVEPTETEP